MLLKEEQSCHKYGSSQEKAQNDEEHNALRNQFAFSFDAFEQSAMLLFEGVFLPLWTLLVEMVNEDQW